MSNPTKRVLIVDDEEDLTWTLTKKLSKDNDQFEVIAVNSGKDAMNVMDQLPVSMVLTDVRMPEVSGLELLQKIKEKYPSTKVVIMTAYGSSDVQQIANTRGCFQYIEKPFEINDLREIILDGIQEKKGFKGSVADYQLSDIIQLNCLGRLNISLNVKHDQEEGIIYFKDGNIVHAVMGDLEGEDAFHNILSWQGGEFAVNRNVTIPVETIFKNWQSLLLESMSRVDENSDLAKEDQEQEKFWRFRKIESLLSKLKSSAGVEHILIHSKIGFPIFYLGSFGKEQEKITEMGDEISALMKTFEKAKKALNNQKLEYWEVQLENQAIFLYKIPYQDAFFTVVGNKKLNPGMVRQEIKKSLMQIAQLL